MIDPPDLAQETLREFLDAEKACPDPPPEVGQRVFTRLSASLGLPPGAGDVMPTSPGPTCRAPISSRPISLSPICPMPT